MFRVLDSFFSFFPLFFLFGLAKLNAKHYSLNEARKNLATDTDLKNDAVDISISNIFFMVVDMY